MQTFILHAQLVKGFMQGFADVRGRGGRAFLEGKHDDIPESYFLNAGSIDEVRARMNA